MPTTAFDGHPILVRNRPLVIAHRGGAALAPENTLAAFDRAVALGVDACELDVHLSRDGQVVLCHDRTLDRTTDGTGPVSSLTAGELARLDAGHRFGERDGYPFRGKGIHVPRLREVLERYPSLPLIVELKGRDPDLARAAVADVRRAAALGRVCFGGFADVTLHAARACGADVLTSGATDDIRWARYRAWFGLSPLRPQFRALQLPERYGPRRVVTRRFVRAVQRGGLVIQIWTVNDPADMRRLLAWGVNGLISDRPDLAQDTVRETAWSPAAVPP
jgi:glycerophosphoryl diester phosphodiesterase